MLIKSGVPVPKALDIAGITIQNTYFTKKLKEARQSLIGGNGIADSLRLLPVLPSLVLGLVAIGEKSGSLDTMLDHIVNNYDMEIKFTLKRLPATLEPIITVVIGVCVLWLALAIFMPIWNLYSLLLHKS